MANNNLQEARQSLENLMRELRITKVVLIDDYFEDDFDVEVIIGWIIESSDQLPEEVLHEFNINTNVDADILAQGFRATWDGLEKEKRKEAALRISQTLEKSLQDDPKVESNLNQLFQIPIIYLSPLKWYEQKDALLSDASSESRTLCLFDQDLSVSPGFASSGSKSGIGLIKETKDNFGENVICCLLTHTIPTLEGEIIAWRELASQNGLDLRNFLPLAKLRVKGDQSLLLFVDGIKKAALNVYCEDLKKIAINIIRQGNRAAIKELENLDVYDFDYMVMRASFKEGAWEADTLMRIFHIIQKDEILRLVLSKNRSRRIAQNLEIARRISGVEISKKLEYKYPQVRPTRIKELYQESKLIIHSPLEAGDIFESTDQQKTFILLGQPCDLMIRNDGQRGSPNLIVPLVAIEKKSSSEIKKMKSSYWRTHAILDYYFQDPKDVAVVSFVKSHFVRVDVLDLAVLSPDGSCKLDLKQGVSQSISSKRFTSGWMKRSEILINQFNAYREKLVNVQDQLVGISDESIRQSLWQSAMPIMHITDFGLGAIPYNDGCFSYGLRRTVRYRQPGSDRLLKLYTQYLSRDADQVDFAQGL